MKTVEETRRELFEAQMDALDKNPGRWLDGEYKNAYGQCAWIGFNAALDAVEIELPQMIGLNESFQGTPISEIRAQNHYNEAVKKSRAAIESTNLGLKTR